MREHNRMCDISKSINPKLNDEELYQLSRNWVIGLLQKISFEDFLPILLGSKHEEIIGSYKTYNSKFIKF